MIRYKQTCQPLVKENLETHKKQRFYLFHRKKKILPLFHRGKSHFHGLLPFQNGVQTRRKKSIKNDKNKNVASTEFFFISFSLYGTNTTRKYSIFIQQLNLFRFRKIFPKNPWDWEPCRNTVRNDKKSWESTQNRERWQVTRVKSIWEEKQPLPQGVFPDLGAGPRQGRGPGNEVRKKRAKAKCHWVENGERTTKYFFNLEKRKYNKKT